MLLLKSRKQWIKDLSFLSGLEPACVSLVISDLTLKDDSSNCDINVSPFIPLDEVNDWLAIVPGLILISNSEEAILRNRASHNKRFADAASTSKEDETRDELRLRFPDICFLGPFGLKKGMPDIDLIVVDTTTNWLLIAELKWLQLPLFVSARDKRAQKLLKGTRQIEFIRTFLTANPNYLFKTGRMEKSLDSFAGIAYCVLCRDYIEDLESSASLYSYTAFRRALEDGMDLKQIISFMESDDWLPKSPVDYVYQVAPYICNEITVHTGAFRTTYREELNLIE